jgi:hypothetical protein
MQKPSAWLGLKNLFYFYSTECYGVIAPTFFGVDQVWIVEVAQMSGRVGA